MSVVPVMLPAPTLRSPDGELDQVGTARWARLAAASSAHRVLISGPMGFGEYATRAERDTVLDVWLREVAPSRLVVACWDGGEADAVAERGVVPLVMLDARSPFELRQQCARAPAGAWVYANPRYCAVPLAPGGVPEQAAGVKLSKTTHGAIGEMRIAHPGKVIVHGSSRDIRASVNAGADAVTAAPLVARVADWPRDEWAAMQNAVDGVQEWLDECGDHVSRVQLLTEVAARAVG